MNEFAANALRKGSPPLSVERISEIVEMFDRYQVPPTDASLVHQALRRVEVSRISYWDALIVEAAIRSGADILYTEYLHHGTRYGALEVRDSFLT